jgi:hypothetical protein
MLARALESVHQQTLLPDAVIVAVDNDRKGAAPTRNRALQQARTDWVAFLDSDDLFLPRHLDLLLRHALKTEADFVYSWFKVLRQYPDGTTEVLEDDPIFPVSHYLDPFDPTEPIETTITTLVRTELAQSVGMHELDRGGANSGEDAGFTLGCVAAGANIQHLVRKTWLWCHHVLPSGQLGNTSGLPGRGDDAAATLLR